MDKGEASSIINSKAVTYIVLTGCILFGIVFIKWVGEDIGVLPLNKRDKKDK